jgi:hypothetical protein
MTHSYAVLNVSPAAYQEIRALLASSGYQHAFHQDDGREVIDMHGIALAVAPLGGIMTTRDEQQAVLAETLYRVVVGTALFGGRLPAAQNLPPLEGEALVSTVDSAGHIIEALERVGVTFGPRA